ncbi:hypothetical protein B0F90DRAFT_1745652, partial [Multifurca ochricompacta]
MEMIMSTPPFVDHLFLRWLNPVAKQGSLGRCGARIHPSIHPTHDISISLYPTHTHTHM